jgi:hypothetical protein
MFIKTPIAVKMFGWTPADAKTRTIASMMRIAPRPISAPSIYLVSKKAGSQLRQVTTCGGRYSS